MSIIQRANDNLKALYGAKHVDITAADVEAVYSRNVLSVQADAKTKKGLGRGYLTGIMYLAPAKLSGIEVCPKRSAGCTAACLFSAGRGRFYQVTRQRMIKTLAWHLDKPRFIATIKESIRKVVVKARNAGLTPVIRLNGTSDILWHRITDIMQAYPDVQFYDYTKIAASFDSLIPANYHLTFSGSERNGTDAARVLQANGNVAVVFAGELPAEYLGYKVINGDLTDLRFLDAKGCVVGLKAKGKAKQDSTGFVVKVA